MNNLPQLTVPGDRENLVLRVNELYHDYQSSAFDVVHTYRHSVESQFWSRTVVPILLSERKERGVDLCSGTGYVPRLLLKELPSKSSIACVDISAGALRTARRELQEFGTRAEFLAADASSVPLPDACADWVSMNAALHHMPSPEAVLREVNRLLKPGGLFCLGHEPNRLFFSSRRLVATERVIWHAFWYLSPSRNVRRIRRICGHRTKEVQRESPDNLDAINSQLLAEKYISQPLTLNELRHLVDIHADADGEDEHVKGFNVKYLIERCFPQYEVVSIQYTDYGGDMLRKVHSLRRVFDGAMRLLAPQGGRLFSWILRKVG